MSGSTPLGFGRPLNMTPLSIAAGHKPSVTMSTVTRDNSKPPLQTAATHSDHSVVEKLLQPDSGAPTPLEMDAKPASAALLDLLLRQALDITPLKIVVEPGTNSSLARQSLSNSIDANRQPVTDEGTLQMLLESVGE